MSHRSDNLNKLKEDFEEKSKGLDEKIILITGESATKDKEIEKLNKQLEDERKGRTKEEHKRLLEKRDDFIDKEVLKWRKSTNLELLVWFVVLVIGLLWLLMLAHWNLNNAIGLYNEIKANIIFSSILLVAGFIFTGITFKKWYDKNHNHSNIENYKKGLKLPSDLKDPD